MIPLFSTKLIRKVDDYAITHLRVPSIVLMENAALEIFKYAAEKMLSLDKSKPIGFICGKGNNGGDGFAVARHFFNNGYKVIVFCLFSESEMTADANTNFSILKKLSLGDKNLTLLKYKSLNELNALKKCAVIFDAMLGSGIKGELKEPYNSIVNKVNSFSSLKIAVDIPTGLDADKGYAKNLFHSHLTVTLGELKPGLFFGDGYAFAGEIKKGNIGISSALYPPNQAKEFLIEAKDAFDSLPQKGKAIHKYSAGKVLTIAGSKNYSGAAILTAKSALRVGAGASVLCFPKSIRSFVHRNLGEVVLNDYNDGGSEFLQKKNVKEISQRMKWADVIAVGPGIGREIETQTAIIKLIKERQFQNIVIDADALYALRSRRYKKFDLKNFILTPHHGEFSNLLGIQVDELKQDILSYGRKFVKHTSSYLVLKGAPTIIFTPDGSVLINSVGNPGMAKFGTGDVLTGVIAGFLSQIKNIERALIAAVYVHSLAADLLVEKFTDLSYTAADIMNYLPNAIKKIRSSVV